MLTAPAFEVTGSFELHQDLFEELDWQPFFGCELAYLEERTANGLGHTKVNQSAESVFAPFGKFHGSDFRSQVSGSQPGSLQMSTGRKINCVPAPL